ncbi:MAG: four helix bundle protein [Bacteroidia bacterium]
MAFKFESLMIWQKALELTEIVNDVSKRFPVSEQFNLTSQVKRAADSAGLNIAEGSQGQTKPEFKRFLAISLRSCIEVVACIFIAQQRKIISKSDFDLIYLKEEELVKMIQSLRNKLSQP